MKKYIEIGDLVSLHDGFYGSSLGLVLRVTKGASIIVYDFNEKAERYVYVEHVRKITD
jgi:hypothetical protein